MRSLPPGLPGGAPALVCSEKGTTSEPDTAPSSTAILGTALAKKFHRDIVIAPCSLASGRPWNATSQSMNSAGGSDRSCSMDTEKTLNILKHDFQHFPT